MWTPWVASFLACRLCQQAYPVTFRLFERARHFFFTNVVVSRYLCGFPFITGFSSPENPSQKQFPDFSALPTSMRHCFQDFQETAIDFQLFTQPAGLTNVDVSLEITAFLQFTHPEILPSAMSAKSCTAFRRSSFPHMGRSWEY